MDFETERNESPSLVLSPSSARRKVLRVVRIIAVVLALASGLAQAQEATYFALQGAGQASVFVDRAAERACIVDGGAHGPSGLSGAHYEGQSLLAGLERQGVRHLTIVCSHPDKDHLAGLVDLLKRPKELAERFDTLTLVDSGYPSRSKLGAASLKEHYNEARRQVLAENPKLRLLEAKYLSAAVPEALELMPATASSYVEAQTFRYETSASSAKPQHGHAVVTEFVLRGDGEQATKLVDFDDAAPAIVEEWVGKGHSADVIVVPHHGSDKEKIESLLAIKEAKSAIVTVNPENQHRHPGPNNLLRLLTRFGRENVHITGSRESVQLDADGVIPRQVDYDEVFNRFVRPQREYLTTRLRGRRDDLYAVEAKLANPRPGDARTRLLAARGRLRRAIRDEISAWEATYGVERLLINRDVEPPYRDDDPPAFVLADRGFLGSPPSNAGARENATAKSETELPAHTGKWAEVVEPRILARMHRRNLKKWTPQEEFNTNRHEMPLVGGVILGNVLDSRELQLEAAGWSYCADEESCHPGLYLKTNQGLLLYWLATHTEAVAATRFVLRDQVALVSGYYDEERAHGFHVNPAIANTSVALAAMRLDVFFGWQESTIRLAPQKTFQMPEWRRLLWYDAPARLVVRDGQLDIEPTEGSKNVMMRIRFVDVEAPWYDPRDPQSSFVREHDLRLFQDWEYTSARQTVDEYFRESSTRRTLDEYFRERLKLPDDGKPPCDFDRDEWPPVFNVLTSDEVLERTVPLRCGYRTWEAAKAQRVVLTRGPEVEAQLRDELEGEDGKYMVERAKASLELNNHIELVAEQSPAIRDLSAFAKTVSVLRWVKQSLGGLPLPKKSRALYLNIPTDQQVDALLNAEIQRRRAER